VQGFSVKYTFGGKVCKERLFVAQHPHQIGVSMKGIKWIGTLLCLIGICLTSFNVYPINIILSLIGSVLWTIAGWLQRDIPLFLVEAVAVIFYVAGVITLFYKV
jgi:hypothetical protein